jgi:hypothetical protein
MRRRTTLPACALLVLPIVTCGCYEFGRPFDESHVPDIRVGIDQRVLREWFGEPIAKVPLVGQKCSERWMWLYGRQGLGATTHSLAVKFSGKKTVCAP